MRKYVLAALLLATPNLWAVCTVTGIYVTDGGDYATITSPTIVITGPGAGGATATAFMAPLGGGEYGVSSIVVTLPGSYTGPVTISFSGSNTIKPAVGYATMGGSCASGGARKRFAWLL